MAKVPAHVYLPGSATNKLSLRFPHFVLILFRVHPLHIRSAPPSSVLAQGNIVPVPGCETGRKKFTLHCDEQCGATCRESTGTRREHCNAGILQQLRCRNQGDNCTVVSGTLQQLPALMPQQLVTVCLPRLVALASCFTAKQYISSPAVFILAK